jgi:hypothetical protein
VLSAEISPELAARLERVHDRWAENNPSWRGRIEVVYVSASGFANLRVVPPRIQVISAGQPFHVISAGTDWRAGRRHGLRRTGRTRVSLGIRPRPTTRGVFFSSRSSKGRPKDRQGNW